jgi:hypothetical protein
VIREHRKLGLDVWCYRWWESGPSGNRVHRRIVLGTAEQLRDMVSARQMTAGLVQEINASDIRMTGKFMRLAQLADHFHQRELGRSNTRLSHSTKRAYQGYLGKWIVPRWGDYLLPNIKAVEVELCLKHLERASGDLLQNPERDERSVQSCPPVRSLRPKPDSVGAAKVPSAAVLPKCGNCLQL